MGVPYTPQGKAHAKCVGTRSCARCRKKGHNDAEGGPPGRWCLNRASQEWWDENRPGGCTTCTSNWCPPICARRCPTKRSDTFTPAPRRSARGSMRPGHCNAGFPSSSTTRCQGIGFLGLGASICCTVVSTLGRLQVTHLIKNIYSRLLSPPRGTLKRDGIGSSPLSAPRCHYLDVGVSHFHFDPSLSSICDCAFQDIKGRIICSSREL